MKDEALVQDSLRWLLRQKQGVVVLKWLLSSSGFMDDMFHPQNSQMSFNAGRRSVGVELVQAARSADEVELSKVIGELL